MILGHAAVAVLAGSSLFRSAQPLVLLLAAYGPDLVDKPLKHFFGAPGHGLGHSGLLFLALCLAAWVFRRRLARAAFPVAAVLFLWAAHLACDWVVREIVFWPFYGLAFPDAFPDPIPVLAGRFYSQSDMHPIAVTDLCLTVAALCVGAWALGRRLASRRSDPGEERAA